MDQIPSSSMETEEKLEESWNEILQEENQWNLSRRNPEADF